MTCGYYLDGISQTWIREASTLDGFKHPPTPLVHSLVQRLPAPEALLYTQTHSPTELTESLQLATKLDPWAAILAQIEGLRGTGEITEEGPRREWKGSFGDGYFNIHVSSLNDRSSVYVFATSPAPK
jgi:hypothetical protein